MADNVLNFLLIPVPFPFTKSFLLLPFPLSHFFLSSSPDPIKGTQLSISLPGDDVLNSFFIIFSTSPSFSALQWLTDKYESPHIPPNMFILSFRTKETTPPA
ncbi:hypothetical protein E1A91_D12G064800v1 [Gossypium mustelinum]|uniref:Uncharacterized protein n=1 Tax=Gossypium mustelinum TaxID=34275 RepID=A0A5D2SDM2_GOSMU|nr:hypothetical protein E1A91_D12G064800v1 [Gossypium mustelinum]